MNWLKQKFSPAESVCIDLSRKKEAVVWGNGATFDNVILQAAYAKCGMQKPWGPFGDRCYRTVKNLVPNIKIGTVGDKHNAADDARNQVEHLFSIYSYLQLNGTVSAISSNGTVSTISSNALEVQGEFQWKE